DFQEGGKSEHHRARCRVTSVLPKIYSGGHAARRADGKCHRENTALYSSKERRRVRVKRWGKSPPLQAQARRHGKPHRVQGQIGDRGAARSMPRVGQASRLSREEKTGWKPVPLCGQVPGTGCSDKWFSPSRKGRRQNS